MCFAAPLNGSPRAKDWLADSSAAALRRRRQRDHHLRLLTRASWLNICRSIRHGFMFHSAGIDGAADRPERPAGRSDGDPFGATRRVLLYVDRFSRRMSPESAQGVHLVAGTHPGARWTSSRQSDVSRLDRVGHRTRAPHRRVRWRRYVSDADLTSLYGRARAFAFLSEYEGPRPDPIEALASGVPSVDCSTQRWAREKLRRGGAVRAGRRCRPHRQRDRAAAVRPPPATPCWPRLPWSCPEHGPGSAATLAVLERRPPPPEAPDTP